MADTTLGGAQGAPGRAAVHPVDEVLAPHKLGALGLGELTHMSA